MRIFKLNVSFLLLFFLSSNSVADWPLLNSGTSKQLNSIYFSSSLTGFAVGQDGMFLKTSDGGNSWQQLYNTSNTLHQVFFSDQNYGWVCGYKIILHTSDGGNTWTTQFSQGSGYPYNRIKSIYFINNNTGYAGVSRKYSNGSEKIVVMKTIDGGISWNDIWEGTDSPEYVEKIVFTNNNEGWIAGTLTYSYSYLLYKTTDGGSNWDFVPKPNSNLSGLYELQYSNGWIFSAGANAYIMRSADGSNWNTTQAGTSGNIRSLFISSPSSGWLGKSAGNLYSSNDFGQAWTSVNSPTSNTPEDMYFLNDILGWACGANGLLMKYTDVSSIENPNESFHSNFQLEQNYPNPFNPTTTIKYGLPKNSYVTIELFNMLGQKVLSLVDEEKNAGYHSVSVDATNLASGVYLYRIQAEQFVQTRKMLLIR